MKKLALAALFILLSSCSSGPNYKEQYQNYLDTVKERQQRLSKADFKVWLKRQLVLKEQEFGAYGDLNSREGRIHTNHEQRIANARGSDDVYHHKKNVSEMQIRRYQEKRKYLEREIFLLKGLLAKYDSPFVPGN